MYDTIIVMFLTRVNIMKKFANLTDREKEEWYDEIYQEGLMAYLSLEQVDREKKILDFKTKQKK